MRVQHKDPADPRLEMRSADPLDLTKPEQDRLAGGSKKKMSSSSSSSLKLHSMLGNAMESSIFLEACSNSAKSKLSTDEDRERFRLIIGWYEPDFGACACFKACSRAAVADMFVCLLCCLGSMDFVICEKMNDNLMHVAP